MIILLGSQKGGCGKSTLSTNLSAALASSGHDVVLVDADRQGTAARWCADREAAETKPTIHCVQKYENIKSTLTDLAARYEIVIVDTAGHDSQELRTAALAADTLVIPFRPSQPDLDTISHIARVVETTKDFNEKLRALAVITMAPTNPSVKEIDEAKQFFDDCPNINLMSTIIHDRKTYRDCIAEGLGVIEKDNAKAKDEISQLIEEIKNA